MCNLLQKKSSELLLLLKKIYFCHQTLRRKSDLIHKNCKDNFEIYHELIILTKL